MGPGQAPRSTLPNPMLWAGLYQNCFCVLRFGDFRGEFPPQAQDSGNTIDLILRRRGVKQRKRYQRERINGGRPLGLKWTLKILTAEFGIKTPPQGKEGYSYKEDARKVPLEIP